MGTGAVYVTLSGLKGHPGPLTNIETIFFFINLSLFILNYRLSCSKRYVRFWYLRSGILSHYEHIVVYPQQAKRLINDPVKGVFVPLIVRPIAPFNVSQAQCCRTGIVICYHCDRNNQLRSYTGAHFSERGIRTLLVNALANQPHNRLYRYLSRPGSTSSCPLPCAFPC